MTSFVIMKRIMSFLAYGNVVVAFSAAGMAASWMALDLSVPINYPLFVFLATLASYGYMHLQEAEQTQNTEHPVLAFSLRNKRYLQWQTVLAFIGALMVLTQFSLPLILWLAPVAMLAALYPPNPLIRKGLRQIPGAKLPLIAGCWSWLSAVLPLVHLTAVDSLYIVWGGVQHFLWIYALAIAFDIRDLATDNGRMLTLPQRGLNKAVYIAWACIGLVELGILVEGLVNDHNWWMIIGRLIPLEMSSLALWRIRRKVDPLFISFHVEALPILYAILMFLSP